MTSAGLETRTESFSETVGTLNRSLKIQFEQILAIIDALIDLS